MFRSLAALFVCLLVPALWAEPEMAPGTIENLSNPLMDKILAAHDDLKAGPDDIVLYYYREDRKYDQWGFWTWATPGGDGGAAWDRTQHLKVSNGVGYLKFKKDGSDIGIGLMGTAGTGLIPRRIDGWTKDGNDDRFFNTVVTNEWVVFSGDQKTYPYGAYRPSIDGARLLKTDTIQIDLSGRQALTVEPSANNFVVGTPDGAITYRIKDMFNTSSAANRDKNFTKRITIVLEKGIDLSQAVTVSNPAYQLPVRVSAQAVSIVEAEKTVPAADYQLGAVYQAATHAVEFRLWAPLSTAVTARLYKANEAKKADYQVELKLDPKSGVWSGAFSSVDPDGLFYDYDVAAGSVHKTVLDPYAQSLDVYRGTGNGRGAILNPAKTEPTGGWEGATDVKLAARTDAVIYEVSVRDLTSGLDSGVKARPGSYLAFIEKLPYLKSLGVTHLQLMPVVAYAWHDETKTAYEANGVSEGANYNWGYGPRNWFSPEGWLASNPADPYNRVVELKTLIKEAHKAGLGVLLDVVYNHNANTSLLDDIVPGYYYRQDAEGKFTSNSGVGNDIASDRIMARRLINDSLYNWVKEYKIDGFRFDLMGLMDVDTILQSRARAATLPDKADVLFEGEGWKNYSGPKTVKVMSQDYMAKTDQVSVFNDEFRDLLKGGGMDDRAKGFLTGKTVASKLLLSNLLGSPQLNYKTPYPGNNMNYIEAHDNLTLHDNISLNTGLKDSDPTQRAELAARIRLGNFLVLTSQGIAFLHSGQESGRTKPKLNGTSKILGDFNHDSYNAGDDVNAYVWKKLPEYQNTTDFTAGMIGIRNAITAFRLGDAKTITAAAKPIEVADTFMIGWSLKSKEGTFTMLVNSSTNPRTFTTPTSLAGGTVLVDHDRASVAGLKDPKGLTIKGNTVTLDPLTAVMVRN
ncbi:MAG: alpha-amylase family glycosyl hydrolase [Spirochaetales bacterium]